MRSSLAARALGNADTQWMGPQELEKYAERQPSIHVIPEESYGGTRSERQAKALKKYGLVAAAIAGLYLLFRKKKAA